MQSLISQQDARQRSLLAKLFVEKVETLMALVQNTRQDVASSSWWLNIKMNCTLALSFVTSMVSLTGMGYCLLLPYSGVEMSANNATEMALYQNQ